MPEPVPAPGDWSQVRASIAHCDSTRRKRRLAARGCLAASIAVLAVATVWRLQEPAAPAASPSPQDAQMVLAADRLEYLRTQSQALEQLLAELPRQPAIERAGTALPIDTIEAQVQWVDHQLLLNGDGLQPDLAERLWRDRVEAMNSLVRLRYADAQRVAM